MIRQQLGQQMMVGIAGLALTAEEKKFIVENNIGGVILMGRNLKEPKQIFDLVREIKSLSKHQADKASMLVGIDMEGGRVLRLKEPFTKWPAMAHLGASDNTTLTFQFAMAMGLELKAFGINLDFAPCVDIFSNPKNTVIGDRALGSTAEIVDKHASALVRGFFKSGVLSCAKHFPGHGNTLLDSHEDLPVEAESDLAALEARELIPFRKSIKSRADFIMTAHIHFPKIDNKNPVTFSEYFIQKLLKEDMRFKGLVITDDLDMGAMIKHYSREEIPVNALRAGAEMLLYCNDPTSPVITIEAVTAAVAQGFLPREILAENHKKILAMKKAKLADVDVITFEEALAVIENPTHKELAAAILNHQVPEWITHPVV